MKKLLTCTVIALSVAVPSIAVQASPADDLSAFQNYFKKKFPETPFADYINGVYSIDKASREQWESIEEFPPYEIHIDKGEGIWGKSFKNGKTFASCFGDVKNIKVRYPHWDSKEGIVRTVEQDINACLVGNGEKPFKYKKGKMASLSAYISYQGRGQTVSIEIPDDPKAQEAYNKGKTFFYAKRGQLNLSCADCHVTSSGNKIRADLLSPALGHLTHFPVYRSKWGGLGTVHRRYGGCNKQVRAKPFKAQGKQYKQLEYFHSYMSNGLELNGPGARK